MIDMRSEAKPGVGPPGKNNMAKMNSMTDKIPSEIGTIRNIYTVK